MAARAAIQVSMSVEYQPIVRALSFTGGGMLTASMRRWTVDFDKPIVLKASGRRKIRIGLSRNVRVSGNCPHIAE